MNLKQENNNNNDTHGHRKMYTSRNKYLFMRQKLFANGAKIHYAIVLQVSKTLQMINHQTNQLTIAHKAEQCSTKGLRSSAQRI